MPPSCACFFCKFPHSYLKDKEICLPTYVRFEGGGENHLAVLLSKEKGRARFGGKVWNLDELTIFLSRQEGVLSSLKDTNMLFYWSVHILKSGFARASHVLSWNEKKSVSILDPNTPSCLSKRDTSSFSPPPVNNGLFSRSLYPSSSSSDRDEEEEEEEEGASRKKEEQTWNPFFPSHTWTSDQVEEYLLPFLSDQDLEARSILFLPSILSSSFVVPPKMTFPMKRKYESAPSFCKPFSLCTFSHPSTGESISLQMKTSFLLSISTYRSFLLDRRREEKGNQTPVPRGAHL